MDIVFIIALALLFAWLLLVPVGWGDRYRADAGASAAAGWLFFLLILVPIMWLALIWIPPMGPAVMGIYWTAPLLVGLLVFFLLAAVVPEPRQPPTAEEVVVTQEEAEAAGAFAIFLNIMFWLFLITAVALLIVGIVS